MAKGIIQASLDGQGKYAGKAYFFNADQYTRYNWATDRAENGYPLSNTAWNLPFNFLGGIDAALNGQAAYKGKAYFFKGGQYLRYDWATEKTEPGYPAALSAWNLPGGFSAGIDAAVNGAGQYAGKAYFFKGNQYIRYDWASDKPDAGYPQPLSAWNLPAPFNSSVDAVINGEGKYAGKAYFFKGNQYARYNWSTDKVELVNTTPGNWPLLVEIMQAGTAKTKVFQWLATMQPQLKAYLLNVQSGVPFIFNKVLFETALNTHFHIPAAMPTANKIAFLQTINSNYDKVFAALTNSAGNFRGRTQAEAVADQGANAAGVPYPAYTFFNGTINFTSSFAQFGPLCQAAMVLHEPVHFVDSRADGANDFYEHGAQYATIPTDKAVHNPSSYACFAQHIFYTRDERYGAGRASE